MYIWLYIEVSSHHNETRCHETRLLSFLPFRQAWTSEYRFIVHLINILCQWIKYLIFYFSKTTNNKQQATSKSPSPIPTYTQDSKFELRTMTASCESWTSKVFVHKPPNQYAVLAFANLHLSIKARQMRRFMVNHTDYRVSTVFVYQRGNISTGHAIIHNPHNNTFPSLYGSAPMGRVI